MRDPGFVEFVGESLPTLNGYAYALTGSTHAGDDLVQDTLVKLAGAWRRIRHDGNPLGYARAVMFRTYVSRWRVLRSRPALALEEYRDTPATEHRYAAVEARDALRRGLTRVPRLQRAVLVLSYLDDMTDDEIAALLDRKPATIRSLRFRGLQSLRKHLNPQDQTAHETAEVAREAR
jgi:RNA polymerase sigma factor (sigma-70 family)